MKALVVTEPFADYAKGDQITDVSKISDAVENNPNQVVAVNLPDAPASKDSPKDTVQA